MRAVLVFALVALGSSVAQAHDETVSASEVLVSDHEVIWKVDVGVAGLGKALKFAQPALGVGDLDAEKVAIARYLSQALVVEINGKTVKADPADIVPQFETDLLSGKPGLARVIQDLRFISDTPISQVRAQVNFFGELTTQHRALIKLRWDDQLTQITRMGPSELVFTKGEVQPSSWSVAVEFLRWGIHHIFIGYDHIAFLIALLLAVGRAAQLFKIVTAFTAAHTITLLLSAFDLLHIPEALTESLIAASIVYVAVENLIRRGAGGERRWRLTFAFGLVHGLGFAGVLRERLHELPGSIVGPIVSFNLGVEVGQLVIVGLAYPLLVAVLRADSDAGRAARRRQVLTYGSVPILILGLIWLGSRIMG